MHCNLQAPPIRRASVITGLVWTRASGATDKGEDQRHGGHQSGLRYPKRRRSAV